MVYHSNIDNFVDVPNNKSLPFVMHEQPDEQWNSYYTLAIAAVSIGKLGKLVIKLAGMHFDTFCFPFRILTFNPLGLTEAISALKVQK